MRRGCADGKPLRTTVREDYTFAATSPEAAPQICARLQNGVLVYSANLDPGLRRDDGWEATAVE